VRIQTARSRSTHTHLYLKQARYQLHFPTSTHAVSSVSHPTIIFARLDFCAPLSNQARCLVPRRIGIPRSFVRGLAGAHKGRVVFFPLVSVVGGEHRVVTIRQVRKRKWRKILSKEGGLTSFATEFHHVLPIRHMLVILLLRLGR
jgi:hypothetical protein